MKSASTAEPTCSWGRCRARPTPAAPASSGSGRLFQSAASISSTPAADPRAPTTSRRGKLARVAAIRMPATASTRTGTGRPAATTRPAARRCVPLIHSAATWNGIVSVRARRWSSAATRPAPVRAVASRTTGPPDATIRSAATRSACSIPSAATSSEINNAPMKRPISAKAGPKARRISRPISGASSSVMLIANSVIPPVLSRSWRRTSTLIRIVRSGW